MPWTQAPVNVRPLTEEIWFPDYSIPCMQEFCYRTKLGAEEGERMGKKEDETIEDEQAREDAVSSSRPRDLIIEAGGALAALRQPGLLVSLLGMLQGAGATAEID